MHTQSTITQPTINVTILLLAVMLLLLVEPARASSCHVDSSFNANVSNRIDSIAIQSDDKIVIGGSFVEVNGQGRENFARLTADGLLDEGFMDVPVNGDIFAVAVQPLDNKILIAGDFTQVHNTMRNGIARLNIDGSLDDDFNPNVATLADDGANEGVNSDANIRALALQADNHILIGGLFNFVGEQPRNFLARLTPSGATDETFNPFPDAPVRAILVDDQQRILIGGDFTSVSSNQRADVVRLNANGVLDDEFNGPEISISGSPSSTILSLAEQTDGKILVGGVFSAVDDGTNEGDFNSIVRLNADGTIDTDFTPPAIEQSFITVRALEVQANGQILVGGSFDSLDQVEMTNNLARLNANGTLDSDFTPNVLNNDVFDIAPLNTGDDVLIGGQFTSVSGITHNNIARIGENFESQINFVTNRIIELRLEGDTETTAFNFDLSRGPGLCGVSSVVYTIAANPEAPTNAGDFGGQFPQNTLNFATGISNASISVAVRGDRQVEPNEGFNVTLSEPVNAIITAGELVAGVILNDDEAPVRGDDLCLPINASNGNIAVVCL